MPQSPQQSVGDLQPTELNGLVFVVAPEASLPAGVTSLEVLERAQRVGIGSAMALRMYRAPAAWTGTLDELVSDGRADVLGLDPFADMPPPQPADRSSGPERRRLICDAVVPHLEARSQWVGIYGVSGQRRPAGADEPEPAAVAPSHPCRALAVREIRCLDRFPLREAENETCWFYPTDDGTFLAWENERRVDLLPGFLPERPLEEEPVLFQRSDLKVLWSLMADDLALTCVGLTCRGRRIEWPGYGSQSEPFATWTAFRVDSSAESTYEELAAITVFQG